MNKDKPVEVKQAMSYRLGNTSRAYAVITDMMAAIKRQSQAHETLMAATEPVTSLFLLNVHEEFAGYREQLRQGRRVKGLQDYAKSINNDPAYDFDAECDSVDLQLRQVRTQIRNLLPEVGAQNYIGIAKWGQANVVEYDLYNSTQTASIQTELKNLDNMIDETTNIEPDTV